MKRPPVFVPERIRRSLALRYRAEPIFKENHEERGSDFHLPLKLLVNGDDKERCQTFGLAEQARRLLSRCDLYADDADIAIADRHKHQLVLKIPSSGYKRIEASLSESGTGFPKELLTTPEDAGARPVPFIPLRVCDLLLYRFATNRAICQLELEPILPDGFPVTAAIFSELVDIISRFPKLAWLEVNSDKANRFAPGEEFTIGSMVARLLHGGNGIYEVTHRTFTHSFAKISAGGERGSKTVLRQVAAKLARQYTTDYAFSEDAQGVHFVSDFDNVIHAVAREGAATIVDSGDENVAYLNEYQTATLGRSYLPLVATNLHYHDKALDLLAHSIFSAPDHSEVLLIEELSAETDTAYREKMTEWRKLEGNVALLNSRFRFRQVSQVTMQNTFNKVMRQALDLDELEIQLRDDMSQMSARMQEAIHFRDQSLQRRFEKRYFWLPVLAAAFAAASLASQLIQTWNSLPVNDPISVIWMELAAFIIPVVIAVLWSIYWRKKRPVL